MGRLLVISSGKGGVGKSTAAVGLGTALCDAGLRVLLVDLDEGLRCLDLMLSVTDRLVFDIGDALADPAMLDRCVYPVPGAEELFLMAAPRRRAIKPGALRVLAGEVTRRYDFTIFDCPAGLPYRFYAEFPSFAEHIIVCNTDKVCVRDARETAEAVGDGAKLLINRFVKRRVTRRLHGNIDEVIDGAGARLVGVVPEDVNAVYAAARGEPLRTGPAAMAFHRVAARLCGFQLPLKI